MSNANARAPSTKIVPIDKATAIPNEYGDDVIAEVVHISPNMATSWLRANLHNRPLAKNHVGFLASEIRAGNWKLNGQAIIIADDESVLDGQHRLHAIIESGLPIDSLVVYGVPTEAFKTIDTGKLRGGSDVISLNYPQASVGRARQVATAARWHILLLRRSMATRYRISNTRLLEEVRAEQSLWACCESLAGYDKRARLMPVGPVAGLYNILQKKDPRKAETFMQKLSTGADLRETDPEYLLRHLLTRDAARVSAKLPLVVRMKMVIKAWNLLRRGRPASPVNIALHVRDPDFIDIL